MRARSGRTSPSGPVVTSVDLQSSAHTRGGERQELGVAAAGGEELQPDGRAGADRHDDRREAEQVGERRERAEPVVDAERVGGDVVERRRVERRRQGEHVDAGERRDAPRPGASASSYSAR